MSVTTPIKGAYENQATTIIKAMKQRQIEGFYVHTIEAARNLITSMLVDGASISWGGSKTLDQIGIKETLYENGTYELLDREKANSTEEKDAIYHKALSADYYLTSTNAFTKDGQLVNIDGNGNRVAAFAYGPKTLIVVTGMNKLTEDVDSAIKRIKTMASPPNTVRLNQKTPCAKTGFCSDCTSPDCICCTTVITRFCRNKNRIKVILIGETLGY